MGLAQRKRNRNISQGLVSTTLATLIMLGVAGCTPTRADSSLTVEATTAAIPTTTIPLSRPPTELSATALSLVTQQPTVGSTITAEPSETVKPDPTTTPPMSATAQATLTSTATPIIFEQLMPHERIQANIDAFRKMPQAEYQHQVERLYWANAGDPTDPTGVNLLVEINNRFVSQGPTNQHRLGIMSKTEQFAGKNSQQTQYEFSAIILGIQSVHDMTPDSSGQPIDQQVSVLWLGTSVGGKRVVIPLFLSDDNPSITVGYYLQNTNNYSTKNVNGEVITQRYRPVGSNDMVDHIPKLLGMLSERVGDSGIFKLVELTAPVDPASSVPALRKYVAGIVYQQRKITAQTGEQMIDALLGSPVTDVIGTLPQSPLPETITDTSILYQLPNGFGTFFVATPILSALGGQ